MGYEWPHVKLKSLGTPSPLSITYGFATTVFCEIIIGVLNKNSGSSSISDTCICYLNFVQNGKYICVQQLQNRWTQATLVEDNTLIGRIAETLFKRDKVVEVITNGTAFQERVWKALVHIPEGETRTYSEVAEMIQKPNAVRAVANAVANNEVVILIPCHRVVSKNGNKYKYGGGANLKKTLLEYESKIIN